MISDFGTLGAALALKRRSMSCHSAYAVAVIIGWVTDIIGMGLLVYEM